MYVCVCVYTEMRHYARVIIGVISSAREWVPTVDCRLPVIPTWIDIKWIVSHQPTECLSLIYHCLWRHVSLCLLIPSCLWCVERCFMFISAIKGCLLNSLQFNRSIMHGSHIKHVTTSLNQYFVRKIIKLLVQCAQRQNQISVPYSFMFQFIRLL